jgi:hypothetical protein
MPNYQQPDFRIPITDSRVGVQIENTLNPLVITGPVAKYVQTDFRIPAAPVAGQLDDAMGKSKITHADGTSSST